MLYPLLKQRYRQSHLVFIAVHAVLYRQHLSILQALIQNLKMALAELFLARLFSTPLFFALFHRL